MKTIEVQVPDSLLLHCTQGLPSLQKRSQFLLALKYFELGELSSGQSAEMCGLSRVEFLTEASRAGVPVGDLGPDELAGEFGNA